MQDDNKLARWLNNEMDEAELREFTASEGFETYRKIRDYSAQLAAPEANLDALYQKIERNRNRGNRKTASRTAWFGRIAAILVIALGLTFFFYTTHTTTQLADAGKRAEFLLPDNSAVVLNAGSEAKFQPNRWENKREIQLNGEAFFRVAKGEKFDVVTPLGTVTVVGTQFNVRARDNRFEVSCFEGKVKVSFNSEIVYLLPGESVAFEDGKSIAVPANDMRQPGWLTYTTSFTAEKPENVIKEIERQYNITVQVTANLKAEPFTGTIPMNDLDTALETIEKLYHLKSEKKGTTIILSAE
jgi:transmembrane sensor